MKKLLLAGIAAALFSAGPALAADMAVKAPMYAAPPIAVYNWTGCYVGANVGGAWTKNGFSTAGGTAETTYDASGVAGGGQVGCDYQFASSWVVGIQGLWDATGDKGSGASTAFPLNTLNTTVNSFATVTARVGVLVNPNVMLYGKGGIAWIDDKYTCTGAATGACLAQTGGTGYVANNTRSGYDVGGGLAWMFAPNWNLWAEYDHIGTASKTLAFQSQNGNGLSFNEGVSQKLDKALVGIDYRFNFGAPVVAKY